MKITTIFFDVGNTLIKPASSEADVLMSAAQRLGISIDKQLLQQNVRRIMSKYEELFLPEDSLWASQERAVGLYMSIFEKICEASGVGEHGRRLAEMCYKQLMDSSAWKPFDDVIETLDGIKALGIRMGIISNWDKSLEGVITGMGLGDYFDEIVSSAVVGLYKPQVAIFELAMQKMGALPKNTLHIGDNLVADIGGARKAGITPVLIDRVDKHELDESLIKVGRLTEVLNYLD